ncbi:MAG: 6,7-dimethyl-8-ribityllumazine synthase [Myxococcaceae bacterium]|nr:6,7-dimethyl-8-ribityllumazine synthase [Myxococcaceae bacterium]
MSEPLSSTTPGRTAFGVRLIEGDFSAPKDAKIAIVAARFNEFIVARLIEGAIDGLTRHGISPSNITLIRTPGAFEMPLTLRRAANSQQFAALIALGAVIRGSTPHFDYVCSEAQRGASAASQESGVPVIFGVLTTDSIEQAVERAGTKAGNKGFDAALAAVEMVNLGRALTAHGL